MPVSKKSPKTSHIPELPKDELQDIEKQLSKLQHLMRSAGIADFLQYLQSPGRIMMMNFFAGIFRGLGILIGMTVVVAALIWSIAMVVDFPLIGQHLNEWLHLQEILGLLERLAPQNGYHNIGGGA